LVVQKGDSVIWPDNVTFKQAWLNQPVYRSMGSTRVQYALREVERRLHHPRAERIEILSDLSIEHVLPEEWMEQWPLPNGNRGVTLFEQFDKPRDAEDVEATDKRDRTKHTFGNLTLLTQPLNSSVSNSTFETKKPEIMKNSALALNRYFHDKDNWDEAHRRAVTPCSSMPLENGPIHTRLGRNYYVTETRQGDGAAHWPV
jgi:Protein of unknown function (DUF1524)